MNVINFNDFCIRFCDNLYEPRLHMESQANGYFQLRKMVEEGIKPASRKEMERCSLYPTELELSSPPDIKYLRFLHPLLRGFIIDNWNTIKNLTL